VFAGFDLYASYRRQTFGRIFWDMVKAVSTAMLVLILSMYIFKLTDVSRILLGIFFVLNIGFLALSKGVVYRVLGHYRKKGFNFRSVLIVGSRERAKDVINIIGKSSKGILEAFKKFEQGSRKKGKVPELWDGKASERIVDVLVNAK
jgi:FlaA1/EpsC-like NDP-sugar epimerase